MVRCIFWNFDSCETQEETCVLWHSVWCMWCHLSSEFIETTLLAPNDKEVWIGNDGVCFAVGMPSHITGVSKDRIKETIYKEPGDA